MTVQDQEAMLLTAEARIMQEAARPVAPADLVARLTAEGIDAYFTRAAMWFLLDRHRIAMTSDRLHIVQTP